MIRLLPSRLVLKNFILPLTATLLFVGAAIIFINSQKVASQQAKTSQQAVANHTQTLQSIENVVSQIKGNNQTNHDTTIKYVSCGFNLLIEQNNGAHITPNDLNACLAGAGLATSVTTTPATSSSSSSPPKASQAPVPTPQSQPVTSSSSSSPSAPASSPSSPSTPSGSSEPKPGLVKQVLNFLGL